MIKELPFDPNKAANADSGVFGLPYGEEEAKLIFLPVPWEATTSYGGGTALGPEAILQASAQVDLFDLEVDRPYEAGFFWHRGQSKKILQWNKKAKALAKPIIARGEANTKALKRNLLEVNALGDKLNLAVEEDCLRLMNQGKIVAVVGGDHSVPFGALRALAQKEREFGVLHIDAHSDTRASYEGFQWSHASIFHNVIEKIPQVKRLVQVGIRDFCEEEYLYVKARPERIRTFFALESAKKKANGVSWQKQVDEMLRFLPEKVWISFDIDGLDPSYCPHTGTPVPGGLSYEEAIVLLGSLARSGRRIIGFDLNEVAPGKNSEWDANVGARLLYKMAAYCVASQGLRPFFNA
jgi:agmatinase